MTAPLDACSDIALVYTDDAHREPGTQLTSAGKMSGPFGRQVANSEFFEALLSYGDWQRLIGVVSNQASSNSLAQRFRRHLGVKGTQRRLEIVGLPAFQQRFFPKPPSRILHLPQPIDTEFGWARHHKGKHAFALSGVTHTLSLTGAMERLCGLVTAPFEAYDTLFCTSRSAIAVVRAATDNYAAYLRERHGGEPGIRIRLAHVPLGVDTAKFRPPLAEERTAARLEFGVAADEVCILFVGRLSYQSKAHPFPLFRAAAEAARRLGRKVHLLFAGWAEDATVLKDFRQGTEVLARGVRTTIASGMPREQHLRAWHAADMFTSMSDNVQETFGVSILEAQACGLPVVVSDWDGCRETVTPDETGFLVKTLMVTGATRDGTSRHLMSETSYSDFLGESSQAVAVDIVEASNAFARLIGDEALRARMGAAGRARVVQTYAWPHVIRQYQEVWREQELVRREHAALDSGSTVRTPVPFPDIEYTFASYPSALLNTDTRLLATDDAEAQLDVALGLVITNHRPDVRITDRVELLRVIETSKRPCSLAALEACLDSSAYTTERRRATLAWMLKYDLLRVLSE